MDKKGKDLIKDLLIVLLIFIIGFSLFDVFNEKLSKKEISGGVVDNLNQNSPSVPTGRISPLTTVDKNGIVYNNIIPGGNIDSSSQDKILISTTSEGTKVFGKG